MGNKLTNLNFYDYFQYLKDKDTPFALLDASFKFLQVNEKYEELFGFKESHFINQEFFIHFIHLNTKQISEIIDEFNSFKKTEKFVYKKFEVITSKREIKIVEIKFKFFLLGDDSFSLISIKELDINFNPIQKYSSIEFNYNESLIQKLKLIKLNEIILHQKNDISIVAHEITSPIAAIKNLIEIIEQKNLDEQSKNYINMIHQSLNHVLQIGNNLVEISNLEANTDFDLNSIELVSFLKEILELFTPIAFRKNITLEFNSSEEEYFHQINKEKFYFAISNLLSNAIKFSHENQIVELRFEVIEGNPIINIIDFGIGIPDEDKNYLFQKFSKSKRIGTKGEKTTGLGLYIVKEIVTKHQGIISVTSEIGKGSIFSIKLENNFKV